MRRREFLAGGTALLALPLAGCAHPPVVLDMTEATPTRIADERSLAPDPGSDEYAVVAAARGNDSVTRTRRGRLFYDTDTVRVNGSVYAVSETRVDSTDVTAYELRIDFNPDDATPTLGEIAYANLPPADDRRLDELIESESKRTVEGADIVVTYGTPAEVGDSVFVPDPQYDILVYEGDRYRVTITSRASTRKTYRYEVTRIASLSAFVDRIRERYRFTLSGLSEAERDVVDAAVEGGYFQESDAFHSVVERFHDHDALSRTDSDGTWLVRYEGEEYLADIEW
ncbi:hypothetical protein [Salarchaeum sp. JOR-1]|uniref:hypothetical protein n=1 Tax=Salarchaeum sp. JOR-1 TaxID=2599399 RepID=UPI0011986CF4|nr:hypothetical protein [Salarchaeum sp. JOR-1]QDX39419.1 hypothetical protein FQU85_00430 [Salarchaeum sp. JOR-1]